MKRFSILAFTILLMHLSSGASNGFEVKYDQPQNGTYHLNFNIKDYNISLFTTSGTTYSTVDFGNRVVLNKKGFAELPFVHASVMLDASRNVKLKIVPGEYEDISLDYPMLPSRGVIYRNQDPSTIPYVIDPKSITNNWYPADMAKMTKPYIIRDIRGTNIYVYPFRYNAVTNTLRVYKTLDIYLTEDYTASVNPLPDNTHPIFREMDGIYKSVFINYNTANRDGLTVGDAGEILVISTSRDEAAIQPYINWKTEKGIKVTKEVVATGTNINQLVKDDYDANPNILYVLLVGDWDDIKCNTLDRASPMDPQVGCVVGDDDYPDIAVGRFSANSPADVTVQVDKAIAYEKEPDTDGTWYSSAIGIASAQGGTGQGDDGESDAAHETVIWTDKLDTFTYDYYSEIFDPGATSSELATAINEGASIINYTGHGSTQSWGTTGFSNSNVANLTNGNMLPIVFSVACDNGDFHTGTCFAEAWARKSGGGAIVFLGGAISQPWDPPMRGQDYFNDVLIGGYDYDSHLGQNGINTSEERTTIGSIVFNGLTLMTTESGTSSDWNTAKTWTIFGDPSLQVRTAAPLALNLSSELIMIGVTFSTTVTSANGPVENALVAISQGDQMFSAYTDASGSVSFDQTLNFGTAKLVVTAFNTQTIYEDVNVAPPVGAYVVMDSYEVNDANGNNNGMLDYGETAYLSVSFINVGTEEATDVQSTLSTSDTNISVDNANAAVGTIQSGETVTVSDAFQVSVGNTVADLHQVVFNLESIGNGGLTWIDNLNSTLHAPDLIIAEYLVDDSEGNGDGRLDPGETADITVKLANNGSSEAFNLSGTLQCSSSYISINSGAMYYGDLSNGDSASQVFNVSVDEACPIGEAANFTTEFTGDLDIDASCEFSLYVSKIPAYVLDLDGNSNSANVIQQCLSNLEVGSDGSDALPTNLSLYASVFVCLGMYPDNHALTQEEGQQLADYLEQGGNLYMEGGDTWAFDDATPVHPMFHINGITDGYGDLSTLLGDTGSLADGMSFEYNGDNIYIDHIEAQEGADSVFNNTSPAYCAAVSYDGGTYKTLGASFEFGGLQDGGQTKDELMYKILDFFGVHGVLTGLEENGTSVSLKASCFPNPFRDAVSIRFNLLKTSNVNLNIYDLNGKMLSSLINAQLSSGTHEVKWNGPKGGGSGIYFYRLQTGTELFTGKIVKIK